MRRHAPRSVGLRLARRSAARAAIAGSVALLLVLAVIAANRPASPALRLPPAVPEDDPAEYLAAREAAFEDLVPGTEKRIVWHGAAGTRTATAVVYIHGFSGSSEELRPVPDLVAAGLGANIVFTRLRGHGRTGPAMAEASLDAWLADVAEALAVARAVGEGTLVLATSTGATLAALALLDDALAEGVEGLVLVSPNFEVARRGAGLLDLPGVAWWGPWIAGPELGFTPVSPAQATYWTERYPFAAVLPMAETVAAARRAGFEAARVPAFFIFSDADRVVRAGATRDVMARWGAPAAGLALAPGPGVDANAHVLAGDILSPALTAPVVTAILEWFRSL